MHKHDLLSCFRFHTLLTERVNEIFKIISGIDQERSKKQNHPYCRISRDVVLPDRQSDEQKYVNEIRAEQSGL